MNNKYPIYIVSKGRWKSRITMKALNKMNVFYYVVIEKKEYEKYAEVINKKQILILPQKYLDDYDTFWEKDKEQSCGPGAARNFAWQHSVNNGFSWHWVMDDNIDAFHRMNRNEKWECETGTIFKIMEDFCERYENIAIAGPNYYSFCKANDKLPAFITNTRIYSCLLIKNNIPYRWRGRYNEDTDLSLRVLKDGYCTVQFNAFLQGKITTQRVAGGNTKEFYAKEGTLKKSQILVDMHPDVSKVVWKFNRWHHSVNYKPFKKNKLIRKKDYNFKNTINNYNMQLYEN
jgi:hypothetical protein